MTCRKIRHLMPLAAGDDLGPRRARAFRAHVDACPDCRTELEAYRATLRALRTAAKGEGVPDWTEGEWQALMARATASAGNGGVRAAAVRSTPWPRWAAASAAGVLVGLVVLGMLFRGPVPGPGRRAAADGRAGEEAAGGQDVVSMTMVSQETGLQIVWFFDKDFDYKGEERMKRTMIAADRPGLHSGHRRSGFRRGPGRDPVARPRTTEAKNLRKEIVKLKYVRAQDIQNLLWAYRSQEGQYPVQSQHAGDPFGQRHT